MREKSWLPYQACLPRLLLKLNTINSIIGPYAGCIIIWASFTRYITFSFKIDLVLNVEVWDNVSLSNLKSLTEEYIHSSNFCTLEIPLLLRELIKSAFMHDNIHKKESLSIPTHSMTIYIRRMQVIELAKPTTVWTYINHGLNHMYSLI